MSLNQNIKPILLTASMITSERFSTLIFDLDGTLFDSMHVWGQVDEDFLSERGFEVTPEYTDFVKSTDMWSSAEYTKRKFGLPESPEEIIGCWEKLTEKAYSHTIPAKPGVLEFLSKMHSKGIKIACATALSHKNAMAGLINNKLDSFFDAVITLDDCGKRVDKSDPAIFFRAANECGESDPHRCMVFEDLSNALRGASKGEFTTCAVYDSFNDLQWAETKQGCDYYIEDWKLCH